MSERMTADTEARRRISEDINTNFFVEAGAGSGKTTALVDRMVAMVAGGIDVEKICAITFTVAASREFFNRFQQKLKELRDKPDVSEEVKERIQTAIRHIDLCFMGTIDAFCNQVLGEHPTRAGVPSTVTLTEDDDKPGLYRREYAKLKRGEYGPEMTDLFLDFSAVQEKSDTAFLECIPVFMNAHASRWVVPTMPEADWRSAFAEQLDQLLAVLETVNGRPENLYSSNDPCRKAIKGLPDALRALRNYKSGAVSLPDMLFALKPLSAGNDESKVSGLALTCEPETVGIETVSLFSRRGKSSVGYCLILSRRGGLLSELKEYQYAVSVNFLSAFASEMAKALKEKGELSFYDHLLYLRDMLRDDAETGGQLVRHIRSRYTHFLIDEFQDTDPLQAEVFFRLAAVTPKTDWRDAELVPGSLFIVGDPKQSIYRFRGADVSSYLSVKQLFVPPRGEVLSLQQNFRSSNELRHWFNSAFDVLMPDETPYQSKFESIPMEDGDEEEGLFTGAWSYRTTKDANAGDVATIIRRLVGNPNFLIHTRKDRKEERPPRMIQYRDIMVITRTRTLLPACLKAMKYYGIPCRVDGRTAFTDCPAFIAMADLMAAFANPSDDLAVYRVLRGNVFRFSRDEITEWRLQGNRLYLYGHEEEENGISAVLTRLDEFRRAHIMLSPAALCGAILDEFDLFRSCGTEDMEYVWYAIELLRNGTGRQGSKSLTDAVVFLKGLTEGKTDTGKVLDLNGELNRVSLANLHKVKGLEAPVVILAQTYQNPPPPAVHMEMDGTDQKRWVLRLTGSGTVPTVYAATERYEDEQSREDANLKAEEDRLMYVAATRAGCALLIPDTGKKCLWDVLRCVPVKELETVIPPLTAETAGPAEFGYEQQTEEQVRLVGENPLLHSEAAEETWQLSRPSELHDSDLEPDGVAEPDPDAQLIRGETSSLLLGSVIHRAMEMLVSSRGSLSDDAIVRKIREEYDLGEDDGNRDIPVYIRNVLIRVRRGGWEQESGVPADILSELLSADEVYCEVPFCVSDGGTVISGVMDAVYRKGDDWYVIDYKTNADPIGLDAVYQDQLAAYRKAAKQLFGSVAGVHTYHIPLLK